MNINKDLAGLIRAAIAVVCILIMLVAVGGTVALISWAIEDSGGWGWLLLIPLLGLWWAAVSLAQPKEDK